jgi:hypothetical protein
MPTNTTITTNYVGKTAGEIVGASFKEADTIRKRVVTLLDDINSTVFLKKIAYTNGKQAYSCGFTPGGDFTLSERALTPVKVKIDTQVCKEDFRSYWSGDGSGPSAHNTRLPQDIQAAMLKEMLGDVAEDTDEVIWTGDSTNTLRS